MLPGLVYDMVGSLAVCARCGGISFGWSRSDVGAVRLWSLYGFSFIRRSVLQLVVSMGPLAWAFSFWECLVSVTFFMFLGISFVISRIIDSLDLFGMPGTHLAGL